MYQYAGVETFQFLPVNAHPFLNVANLEAKIPGEHVLHSSSLQAVKEAHL
jgi:hypothetical protein